MSTCSCAAIGAGAPSPLSRRRASCSAICARTCVTGSSATSWISRRTEPSTPVTGPSALGAVSIEVAGTSAATFLASRRFLCTAVRADLHALHLQPRM